ncbi:MAG: endopeptidase La [Bacteroidetes bacterium GWC2_33_15]|nr:MAG: endopeptidase La [Bacteroidetes bacterium GWA2_33_15]OFX51361.1 MAG: endopeptidase La [Bacteroidetes bacterium GWC2_33_15]OFX63145.1 MAG: endopeptidase La [Bacteroidetes bacterium GWB2_32_14]OFX70737.1 MAG: endopeptidase La [Bacteroidetes bacterium GWD2_33_33]HAN18464.1 endopeptidase La [Bacteroidales bacterium]
MSDKNRNTRKIGSIILGSDIENNGDFIPLISDDEDDIDLQKSDIPQELPILPLRNTVLFPGVILPITVGREKSIRLVNEIYRGNKIIGTVAQINPQINEPEENDFYKTGTVAHILKVLEMPDGSTSVIIQGKQRFKINQLIQSEPYHKARVSLLKDKRPVDKTREFEAIVGSLKDISLRIIKLSSNIPPEASFAVRNIENSKFLINFICSNSDIEIKEKQTLLEISNLKERAIKLLEHQTREMQMLELKNDIQSKVKTDLDRQQREYLLHQQMKTIQDELGGSPLDQEITDLRKQAEQKKWSKEVGETFNKEVDKLQRLNPASGEYSVQLNYLQTLLDLPWNEFTEDIFDLKRAQKILDEDHFGLENVKDRILEYLAVLKLKGDLKSPILCLFGPPGVGKTSLGKSIAKALGRNYVRMSLGGLHDEAEIRGHRKTYIGAMPGRIIQNIKKSKSSNPVFILDEIDKVGKDFHGDPASALLEVLDPEQNNAFHDNYLELEYDLSNVMFIATANTVATISPALRDRMEMIDVSGYIVEEKIEIAKRHLVPKQLEAHGVDKSKVVFKNEIIEYLIENHTRESGVRLLDKTIAKVVRNIARKIAFEEKLNKTLTITNIKEILGPPEFSKDRYQGNEYAGVVTGLAWTAFGGEILFIESSLSKGKGTLTLTGNLGDVMKESAVIALEYIKSHAADLKISDEAFEKWNIHIHVPEGAIPKDGPSAGITMASSIASLFTQRKVKSNLAMTGEITLRGKVLPVGGIKEKILAAKRAGITDIIISNENRKDIGKIKDIYIEGLKFHYVKDIMEVLEIALLKEKVKKAVKV